MALVQPLHCAVNRLATCFRWWLVCVRVRERARVHVMDAYGLCLARRHA